MVQDHLGNTFSSQLEMCKYWNKPPTTVRARLDFGWSLKDALERPVGQRNPNNLDKVQDHLGNKFSSQSEMCRYWNKPPTTVRTRLEFGWSLKDALERPVGQRNPNNLDKVQDHLGNTFSSQVEMCKHWNKPPTTVRTRLKFGWSLKDALEIPIGEKNTNSEQYICDHIGNKFKSTLEMCRYWNKSREAVNERLREGWSLKDALEIPIDNNKHTRKCTDHLGNQYNSFKEMCEAYNHSQSTIYARIKSGLSLKDALETGNGYSRLNKYVYDHLGNKFKTKRDMYRHWNISESVVNGRLRNGWSLQKALETPEKTLNSRTAHIIKDHLGNEFSTKKDMAKHWNIEYNIVLQRLENGWSLKDALETPVRRV